MTDRASKIKGYPVIPAIISGVNSDKRESAARGLEVVDKLDRPET
jgi:hypothetical protein